MCHYAASNAFSHLEGKVVPFRCLRPVVCGDLFAEIHVPFGEEIRPRKASDARANAAQHGGALPGTGVKLYLHLPVRGFERRGTGLGGK